MKKNDVVEQALFHSVETHPELPEELFVPRRIVLEDREFDCLAESLERPAAPTAGLRELMRGEDR